MRMRTFNGCSTKVDTAMATKEQLRVLQEEMVLRHHQHRRNHRHTTATLHRLVTRRVRQTIGIGKRKIYWSCWRGCRNSCHGNTHERHLERTMHIHTPRPPPLQQIIPATRHRPVPRVRRPFIQLSQCPPPPCLHPPWALTNNTNNTNTNATLPPRRTCTTHRRPE